MTHAPKFWAGKLDHSWQGLFWSLIEQGFGGETAYCRILQWEREQREDYRPNNHGAMSDAHDHLTRP